MTIGNTKRLKVEFADWEGLPVDVNDRVLRIYDSERNIIEEITTGIVNSAVGVYFYDYVMTAEHSGPLTFYFEGEIDGLPISRRAYIDREWAEFDIKALLLEWVKDTCKNDFMVNGEEVLPGGVVLFLNKAEDYLRNVQGISSESLGDYSVSFDTDLPQSLKRLLRPYRKVKLL